MYVTVTLSVTGSGLLRPALKQIQALCPGDILLLHRNSGADGGIVAMGKVVGPPLSKPEQFDVSAGKPDYHNFVPVETWIRLAEPLSHADIDAAISTRFSIHITKTVNLIDPKILRPLLDLFFDRWLLT